MIINIILLLEPGPYRLPGTSPYNKVVLRDQSSSLCGGSLVHTSSSKGILKKVAHTNHHNLL